MAVEVSNAENVDGAALGGVAQAAEADWELAVLEDGGDGESRAGDGEDSCEDGLHFDCWGVCQVREGKSLGKKSFPIELR